MCVDSDLQRYNEQYGIPGHLSFQAGPGGLVTAVISNAHAEAEMTLAGGHVMRYTPRGGQPVLWVSPNASFTVGTAMRGGVPVCWPWFALHPDDPQGKPLHGLVRTMLWEMRGTQALPDGATEVRMAVRDTPETLALWPHPFELELAVRVGPRLRMEWTARNPGSAPYRYTGALHPYFSVSDLTAVTVRGLEGTAYLDKNDGFRPKTLAGPLRFEGMVDYVFLDTCAEMVIEDSGLGRAIHVAKEGSRTSVVWNPAGADAKMPDVGAGQHRYFLCVEAVNAVNDVVDVPPGGEGRLAVEIWAEQEIRR